MTPHHYAQEEGGGEGGGRVRPTTDELTHENVLNVLRKQIHGR